MNKTNLLAMLLTAAMSGCCSQPPQLGRAPLDDVIDAMTLEEKVSLVVGTGMTGFSGDNAAVGATRYADAISNTTPKIPSSQAR